MLSKSISYGISFIRKKPGLVLLLFVVNLVFAFVLTLPIKGALEQVTGNRGVGELAGEFDIVVWADIFNLFNPALGGFMSQLIWLIPVIFLWNVASSVGIINAVRDGGIRSFWPGVGHFTGRGVLLALLFAIAGICALVGIALAAVLLYGLFGGEAGTFWISTTVLPLMLLIVFSLIDLAHDYARIKLVRDETPILTCFAVGVKWPLVNRTAFPLYVIWSLLALIVIIVPTVIDANTTAATSFGVWTLFFFQQIFFLLRAAVTIAWFGSEVHLFEQIEWNRLPLIADAARTDSYLSDSTSGDLPGRSDDPLPGVGA